MDDCFAVGVCDDADLEWCAAAVWADEQGDVGVVGGERSPVMSVRVQHVVVVDAVLVGARLDVHDGMLTRSVNMY